MRYWNSFILSILSLLTSFCALAQNDNGYSVHIERGRVRVKMAEYSYAMRNPLKGFREFFMVGTDPIRKDYPYPYGSMIKEYMPWNMLERNAEDSVETIIAYSNHRWKGIEEKNVKVIPRVLAVWVESWHGGWAKDPNNIDDLNGWHWPEDIPAESGPYKQIPGSVGAYVEPQDSLTPIKGGYFHPTFTKRVEQLVEKLGVAWDNDPRVAYVEMGIIGEWGEHHDPDLSTVYAPHDEPRHIDNRTWIPGIQKVLGDAFSKAFKNKKVMVRYAYEFKDYDFGIYWDSWAQPEEQGRGYDEMIKRGDYWRRQPVGGEITWNWGSLAKFRSFEQVVADDHTRKIVIEQIRNLHCNHLGGITWANFEDEEFMRNAAELQKAMGYRFVMEEASYTSRVGRDRMLDIAFTVQNRGSSPFYYDWDVEIALLDCITHEKVWGKRLDDVKISQWMPGEEWDSEVGRYQKSAPINKIERNILVDRNIPEGRYILAIGIIDAACDRPTVRFANTNYFTGGFHPLGYIGIGKRIRQAAIDAGQFNDLQSDRSLNYATR